MALPADYEDECLYGPEAWFITDILEIDRENHRIVATLDTERLETLVNAQRVWPGHPKHLPGAVAIQMTGTLGHLHAVYCMDLRATEGWVGFGTHIKRARFGKLGTIGEQVIAHAECTRKRQMRGTWFMDYSFRFEQGGQVLYESTQTAAWFRTDHRGPRDTASLQG